MNKPRNIALLLAGGNGLRMHISRPKQYVEVEGRAVLAYTLAAFASHPEVDAICVVCAPEWRPTVERLAGGCGKFRGTFDAGDTGLASLRHGVDGLTASGVEPEAIVLVHDGVRPLVSHSVISSAIATCRAQGSAVAGCWGNEAYMEAPDRTHARGYVPREQLCGAQTPQAFPLATLREAFAEADARGLATSQSLFTLMAELGRWPVALSKGDTVNIKITCAEDLAFFQTLVAGGWPAGERAAER